MANGLAAERDVILFDYPGIGGSAGETESLARDHTFFKLGFVGAAVLLAW